MMTTRFTLCITFACDKGHSDCIAIYCTNIIYNVMMLLLCHPIAIFSHSFPLSFTGLLPWQLLSQP